MAQPIPHRKPNLNAYKHGLTGQTLVIEPQDKPLFDEHCKSYVDLYKPVGRPEQLLVQMIADDYWRALRGRALETAHMSRIFERPSVLHIDAAEEKMLYNLALYVQRIERSIRNHTKELKEMQAERRQSEAQSQSSQPSKPKVLAASASSLASTDSVFSPPAPTPSIPSADPPKPNASPVPNTTPHTMTAA